MSSPNVTRRIEGTIGVLVINNPPVNALSPPSLKDTDFADCDIVIEAVFENMALKQQISKRLGEVCKPGAIIATNTSGQAQQQRCPPNDLKSVRAG